MKKLTTILTMVFLLVINVKTGFGAFCGNPMTISLDGGGYSIANIADIISKGPIVDVRAYASFSAAIDAIGTTSKTLLIPNSQSVTANKTVPKNVTLYFIQGGSLNISSGVVVTINGHLEANLYQIFYGVGTVTLGVNSVKEIYPEWFGAGHGINSSANINKAFDSCVTPVVRLAPNTVYYAEATILVPSSGTLLGAPGMGSCIRRNDYTNFGPVVANKNWTTPTITDHDILIDGIRIWGNRANQTAWSTNIAIYNANKVKVLNCLSEQAGGVAGLGHGIQAIHSTDVLIQNNITTGCGGDGINIYGKTIRATITNNTSYDNDIIGIESEGRDFSVPGDYTNYRNENVIISNNQIYGNLHGILIAWTDRATVKGNVITDNDNGLKILGSTFVTAANNSMSKTGANVSVNYGILISPETFGEDGANSNISLIGNILSGCDYIGIRVDRTKNFIVKANVIDISSSDGIGIYMYALYNDYGIFDGNVITASSGSTGNGIFIDSGVNNLVVENTIIDGFQDGIKFYGGSRTLTNVRIVNNTFRNLTNGIETSTSNIFADSLITGNKFSAISGRDILGNSSSPTNLSSTFVKDNFHTSAGVLYWNGLGAGAAPTSGTWKVGDYIKNRTPAVGQPKGWYCTVSGTPGTWISEGNL